MFRITEDPSSGSLVQCLAKNYKNDSIVSVDMDRVGVMAAYCDRLCVCAVHYTGSHYILNISTNYIFEPLLDNKVFVIDTQCKHEAN